MRGVLVGLGSIGRRHARNWATLGLGELTVVRRPGAPPLPEPLGVPVRELDSLATALAEQPDLVLVTNPSSLHRDVACQAIAAGAHVFVEKPLDSTLDGIAELLDAAAQRQRQVMVGYNLRFHPGLQRMKALVQAGAIGRIVSARAEVGEYLPGWHPNEDYRQSYSGRRDLGGGAVLTFSHELDSLCWLLGGPRAVTAVAAHTSSLETDTEDVAEIILEFSDGPLASVHVDYLRRPATRGLELIGEEGVLRWSYDEHRLWRYRPDTSTWDLEVDEPAFERNTMFLTELRHVANRVAGQGAAPLPDGAEGAAILALALASLRASATGCRVDLEVEGAPVTTWLSQLGR